METYRKEHYTRLAKTLEKKLVQRNFEVIICDTLEVAKEKALEMIELDKTVGFGGSMSIVDSGLITALHERQQKVFDREKTSNFEERNAVMKQCLTADYFLTSFNGLSKDGAVVNVDNLGNRVAAITYGPEYVLAFVGVNKIYGDLEHTIESVRHHVAPLNVARITNRNTPCQYTGLCNDCLSEDCVCNVISTIRRSAIKGRIKIFLILEECGM